MPKTEPQGTENEGLQVIEPTPQPTEDHTQRLQLANIEDSLDDLKKLVAQREQLAHEALQEEVEVTEEEPEKKSGVFRILAIVLAGAVFGSLAYYTMNRENSSVSPSVEAEA